MKIHRLTARGSAAALPLLEAQYREHQIAMGGARLLRAVRRLLAGHGAIFLALDPGPVGLALLSYQITVEQGGRVACKLPRARFSRPLQAWT